MAVIGTINAYGAHEGRCERGKKRERIAVVMKGGGSECEDEGEKEREREREREVV